MERIVWLDGIKEGLGQWRRSYRWNEGRAAAMEGIL